MQVKLYCFIRKLVLQYFPLVLKKHCQIAKLEKRCNQSTKSNSQVVIVRSFPLAFSPQLTILEPLEIGFDCNAINCPWEKDKGSLLQFLCSHADYFSTLLSMKIAKRNIIPKSFAFATLMIIQHEKHNLCGTFLMHTDSFSMFSQSCLIICVDF